MKMISLLARCLLLTALLVLCSGASASSASLSSWHWYAYGGAPGARHQGAIAVRVPSYSLTYPPWWTVQSWPDTLAGYGRLTLWSPAGATLDLVLEPLQRGAPSVDDLLVHDAAAMTRVAQSQLALPLGTAIRLSGRAASSPPDRIIDTVYLKRSAVVYRWYFSAPVATQDLGAFLRIVMSLHSPAQPAGPGVLPPAPPQPSGSPCCHCPVWGTGWGTVLARLDGVAVYSNAGNVDNGCAAPFGIAYQCVELVQRYFALRWHYPNIWSGVAAAADMRFHHPPGVVFVPNGGSPGPREGDALLFYGGAFGHVALIRKVDLHTRQLDLVEENWSPTGEAQVPIYSGTWVGIRNSAYGSYTVAGWLHSLANTGPSLAGATAT
jgi:hypothetical protein